MYKCLFLIFSLFNSLFSQNILPNGNFEINIGAGRDKLLNAFSWVKIGDNYNNSPDLIGTGYFSPLAGTGSNLSAFDQTGNFYVGWHGNESFGTFLPYKIPSNRPFKIKFRYAFHDFYFNNVPINPFFSFVFSELKPDNIIEDGCFKVNKKNVDNKNIKIQKEYHLSLEKITSDVWFNYESDWILPGNKDLGQWLTIIGVCSPTNTPTYQFIDDIEIILHPSCASCFKMNEPLKPGIKMNYFSPNTDGYADILFLEYENMTHYNLYVFDPYLHKIVYCVENEPAAISSNGKPAVAWDGSQTNTNCKRIGGLLPGNANYELHYKVWNCNYSYQPPPFNITKISNGNNGNAPGLFPADPQYWGCCVKNYHIKDQTLTHTPHASPNPDLWYRASEWITAENSTVKKDAYVRFTAGDVITLTTGFTVEADADFEAYIQPCATQKTDFQSLTESTTETLENISEYQEDETQAKAAEQPSLRIYPNPFGTELSIQSETELLEVWLTDLYGRKIISSNSLQTNTYTLSTQVLTSGCYILHLRAENGISTHKVCKE